VEQTQWASDGSTREGLRGAGTVDLRFRGIAGGGEARLTGPGLIERAYQSGCLRMRLVCPVRGQPAEAVLLNTAGGLCDGDRLDQRLVWAAGAAALVTTQAAEKVYRARHQGARIATSIEVGDGATSEWLPQESILFDNARLHRTTDVRLAPGACFVGGEAVVLGRAAMGETMRNGLLEDRWRIWRGGRLIYADAMRLDSPIAERMTRAAVGAGAAAMAVLIHVSARAGALQARARAAAEGARGLAAVSCWGPLLVARLLASDGATLRHDSALLLSALRDGRPVPRIWGY